jgi:hypothetical protein
MDWWKANGNQSSSKMNSEAPSKTTRKYNKTKTKAEISSTIGQSTMLAFVENKESKNMIVDPSEVCTSSSVVAPSPPPTDTTTGIMQHSVPCDMLELGINIRQTGVELPRTPSVKRVSVNDGVSTGLDVDNSCVLNESTLPEQKPSDSAQQVLFAHL